MSIVRRVEPRSLYSCCPDAAAVARLAAHSSGGTCTRDRPRIHSRATAQSIAVGRSSKLESSAAAAQRRRLRLWLPNFSSMFIVYAVVPFGSKRRQPTHTLFRWPARETSSTEMRWAPALPSRTTGSPYPTRKRCLPFRVPCRSPAPAAAAWGGQHRQPDYKPHPVQADPHSSPSPCCFWRRPPPRAPRGRGRREAHGCGNACHTSRTQTAAVSRGPTVGAPWRVLGCQSRARKHRTEMAGVCGGPSRRGA